MFLELAWPPFEEHVAFWSPELLPVVLSMLLTLEVLFVDCYSVLAFGVLFRTLGAEPGL